MAEDLARPGGGRAQVAPPAPQCWREQERRRLGAGLALRRTVDAVLFGLLVVGLLAYLWAGIYRTGHAYDEGFAVYGAHRVLLGEVPHRDFWSVYPPGQFYTLAGLFLVFGETLLVERLWSVVVHLALALSVYLLVAALVSRRVALLPCVLVALWLAAPDYFGYAVFPALALSLLATWCLVQYVGDRRARWLVASGALVGLATVYRHDLGFYAAASLGMVYLLALLLDPAGRRSWGAALGRTARGLGAYALGGLVVALPVVGHLVAEVPLAVLWDDLVGFPLTVNRQISYLEYPQLIPWAVPDLTSATSRAEYLELVMIPWVRFYVPLLACGIGLVVGAALLWRGAHAREPGRVFGILALAVLGLALFNHTLNRFDWMHALPSSIVAAALVAVLLARVQWRGRIGRVAVAGWAAVVLGLVYVVPPVGAHMDYVRRFSPLVCHATLPRAGCVDLYADEEWALSYVRSHTAPGERIFVGNTTHDRAFGSNILFYFLAERDSATRYHELVSGVSTTRPVQETIVADLERHGVRYVVLSSAFDEVIEPNASMVSSGVTVLDDYLRAHYAPVAQYAAFTILQRQ